VDTAPLKALHILGALVVALILHGIFLWIGWDWTRWPINALFGIYVVMILFSPKASAIPFSKVAKDRLDAYIAYCFLKRKPVNWKEYTVLEVAQWTSQLPYPVDIMAAYTRLKQEEQKRKLGKKFESAPKPLRRSVVLIHWMAGWFTISSKQSVSELLNAVSANGLFFLTHYAAIDKQTGQAVAIGMSAPGVLADASEMTGLPKDCFELRQISREEWAGFG
jgi:hypothetical protein